ncbi:glycosyltransferase [Bacillus sp. FJAT-49705]|uniref:Glycosyltransferase n=1 Tax=Cytobacillus citreus TaxID=2833586 RepID=A0ABS5NTX7_9BACI|nr:glycosyltransferase [Cytobacillus citreus]MBS4191296.1 glycosyltransferase [Cytobacillus citreus]
MMEEGINVSLVSKDILSITWKVPDFIISLVENYFELLFTSMISAIRIYDVTSIIFDGSNAHYYLEAMIGESQENWKFKNLKANRNYCVEVGIKISENQFFPLLRSNTVRTWENKAIFEDKNEIEVSSSSKNNDARRNWNDLVSTYSYYGKSYPSFIYERGQFSCQIKKPNIYLKKPFDKTTIFLHEDHKRKKILLLTWEYPPYIIGGLSRHVHGLAGGLHKKDYEVHVITANPNHQIQEEFSDGIHIYRVNPLLEKDNDFLSWIGGLNLAMIQKVMELSKIHHFSLIHAHDWLVGACGLTLKEFIAAPLVVTIHATEFGRNNGIYNELQRFIYEKEQQLIHHTKHLIVCSTYMKKELHHVFSMKKDKRIWTIPNGIEEKGHKGITKEVLSAIPIQKNKRLIFSVGRIVKEKGFDTLIEAAYKLHLIYPDLYFIIAGKGPMLNEYRNKVIEKCLQDVVFFIGFVTDEQKNALFSNCTIAVFPSRYEPFGIVAIESLSKGIPTIASNTGGLKEIIQHEVNGLLMEAGNSDSLLEQVVTYLENESKARKIGSNGRKMVESVFSWERIAKETNKVYKEAIINNKVNSSSVVGDINPL